MLLVFELSFMLHKMFEVINLYYILVNAESSVIPQVFGLDQSSEVTSLAFVTFFFRLNPCFLLLKRFINIEF